MNYENILTKTSNIITNLNNLDKNIIKIKKKIMSINKMYSIIKSNKILIDKPNTSDLLFQCQVLKNEYLYYKNIYDLVITKYSKELHELSENIIMVIISLKELDIDFEAKNVIFSKIIRLQKITKINYGIICEIINTTINNLKLIDELIHLFNSHIENTKRKNLKENNHNINFELTIEYKKKTLLLEYNKHCDKLDKMVSYFNNMLNSILNQIETSKLLEFFLQEKSI